MMKKRLLASALSLTLLLTATACRPADTQQTGTGDDSTETADDTDAPDDTDDTDEPTETDDSTDPSGDDAYAIPEDVIPDETLTLEVYTQLANYSGEQIGWFADIMLEKFNVVLNIINEGDGTYATRSESGNLGDLVVFGNDADQYIQAIENGLLFDWEDEDLLSNYGPYIEANMEMALEKNRNLSPDGGLYGFGHNVGTSTDEHEAFFYGPYLRWDLYKEAGYPEVDTLEDFIPVLEQMVALQPTSDTGNRTYGASLFKDWDGDMVMFVKSTAALYGYDEFGIGLYNVNDQSWEGVLEEDGAYMRMLRFYNQLYQRDLLDPDSMTQTYDDMAEDYQTGSAIWNIFDWMSVGLYNTDEHLDDGKAIMALAAGDQQNIVYGLNIYGGNRVWTIGANTNYPELVMAIINWLSTPEGKMISTYGPQGVTWDYDEQGRPFLTELGELTQSDGQTEMTDGYTGTYSDGTSKINNETWSDSAVNPDAGNGDSYLYLDWETREDRPVSEIEADWQEFTGYPNANAYLIGNDKISISPGTTFSMATRSDELQAVWVQVTEAIKNYSWQAIYAESDEAFEGIVADMNQALMDYGYEQCAEWTLEQATRRAEAENEARADG